MRRTFVLAFVLFAFDASAKTDSLAELEARVKALGKAKDVSKDVEALFKSLGVVQGCSPADCKKLVSTKWLTANLDSDSDDEKVLAITTSNGATCASANLDVIVLESGPKGWRSAGHTRVHVSGAAPLTEVTAAAVHDSALKDLVVHVDGECSGTREQSMHVVTFEHGHLEELAAVNDLTSYKLLGTPPVTLQINGASKLLFDPLAFAYDALPPYEAALKSSVSKDDDATLSIKECAASIPPALAVECGLAGKAKVQVLVQHGRAIGLSVSSTPAKPSFVRCMRQKLAQATWNDVPGATGCTRTFNAG